MRRKRIRCLSRFAFYILNNKSAKTNSSNLQLIEVFQLNLINSQTFYCFIQATVVWSRCKAALGSISNNNQNFTSQRFECLKDVVPGMPVADVNALPLTKQLDGICAVMADLWKKMPRSLVKGNFMYWKSFDLLCDDLFSMSLCMTEPTDLQIKVTSNS